MTGNLVSRRKFLGQVSALAAAGVLLPGLTACRNEGPATARSLCGDTSDLTAGEKHQRESLQYVDLSPRGEASNCRNCQFFQAAQDDSCGACSAVKGPIDPRGFCNIWTLRLA